MSAAWLAELAPDHAPPAAGWWPPALGWWLVTLGAIIAAAVVVFAARWWREPRRVLRRAAMRELRHIRSSGAEGPAAARAIETLLRRHAVALHGRERAARLTGAAWLEFAGVNGGAALAGETGRSLLAAAFGPSAPQGSPAAPVDAGRRARLEREQWLAAAAQLIRRSGRRERAASRDRATDRDRAASRDRATSRERA